MTGPANLDRVVPAAWRVEPDGAESADAASFSLTAPRSPADDGASGEPPVVALVHHAVGAEALAAARAGAGGHARLAAAACVALLAHVGLLLALERVPHGPVGAAGFDIEAVSIEVALLPATAIESRAQAPAAAAAAGDAIAVDDGSDVAQPAAAATAPAVKETAPLPPAEAAPALVLLEAKPEPPDPDRPALPAAEKMPTEPATKLTEPPPEPTPVAKVEPKEEPPPKPVERTQQEPEKQKPDEKPEEPAPQAREAAPASTAAAQGGAAARAATSEQRPTAGVAAASRGQIAAYARSVVGALARSAPRGKAAAGRGTVRVVFAIGSDGSIEDVRVKQSSGRSRLDDLAVAAVRGTRFPAPPSGMTLADRTYEIPYHFR